MCVIGGVEETGLKEEIAESEEGRNKLRGINCTIAIIVECVCAGILEVYRLARRVYSYLKEKEPPGANCSYSPHVHYVHCIACCMHVHRCYEC